MEGAPARHPARYTRLGMRLSLHRSHAALEVKLPWRLRVNVGLRSYLRRLQHVAING